jgi:exosortase
MTAPSTRDEEEVETAGPRTLAGMSAWEWAFVAMLGVAFLPAVMAMEAVWSTVDFASHGYLVPLVAVWAATSKRRILPSLPRARDSRGLVALAAGFLLYLVGAGTSIATLQGLGMVAGVAAAVLYLRGAAWLRVLSFPLAYLLFMVPLPETLLTPLIVELQLFVSEVGVSLLQAAGVAVFRLGNVIELADGATLFVAEACSGITSVVTLLPLAVFLAYFTERTLGRRLILVAAVVPLAMIGNLIRVVITVLAAREWGTEAATGGVLHDLAGVGTYVLGCLALLGVGWLMRLVAPPPRRGAADSPRRDGSAARS